MDKIGKMQQCPYLGCGNTVKDLKTHLLTHQEERPEKCPVPTCEYHIKGFARRYDKNRHAITHYRRSMVCDFCPGSGTPAETCFNRADLFKRHLAAAHGAEKTALKSTNASDADPGDCSICLQTFPNAHDFSKHLDDCVLRVVLEEDPAEAVNEKLLSSVADDEEVIRTLQRNNLAQSSLSGPSVTKRCDDLKDETDEGGEDGEDDNMATSNALGPSQRAKSSGSIKHGTSSEWDTRDISQTEGTVRKRRKIQMPSSWGYDKEFVTLKKRVMAAFDGPRRLAKDDMVLSTEDEVRIPLGDGKSYTTDLDVFTIARAEVFHRSSEEEKGRWVSEYAAGGQDLQVLDDDDSVFVKQEEQNGCEIFEPEVNENSPRGPPD